jgi:serine/threonine-protein phosphatase 4 regulatory subunit 1
MADLGFDFPDDDYEQETNNNTDINDDIVETIPSLKDESLLTTEVIQNESKTKLETMPEDETEDDLLADEKWTSVERVYAFKENDVLIHRLLLAKELPNALEELGISEAVKHVIPIMEKLAYDMDDTVRETFSSELDQILLYFYKVSFLYNTFLYTCLYFTNRMHLTYFHAKKMIHKKRHLPL